MNKSLLALLIGFAPFAGSAEVISESQATAAALHFFASTQSRASNQPLRLVWAAHAPSTRSVQTEAPSFYVFNRGVNEGFVILSGDNALSPVLGYATQGTFDVDKNMPAPLEDWIQQVHENIRIARTLQLKPSEQVTRQWHELTVGNPIIKLTTAEWDQREPYNAYLPGIGDWHGYTGCTITASAIVMAYHQWPDCGVGKLKGYYTNGLGVDVPGVTLGHPYLWDKMPGINGNVLNSNTDSPEYKEQEDAVSTLMRDLGIMYKARYDYDATSADIEVVPFKIVRHMKYHEGAMHLKEEHFSEAVWQKLLREELDEKRPIIFAGYKTDGSEGHSIVLDGYDDLGCFSVNWGWSGSYNGFYNLESLRAGTYGTAYGPGGYSERQEAIIRIQPNREGAGIKHFEKMIFTIKPLGGSTAPMGLHIADENVEVAQGQTFTISAGAFMNFGSDHFAGNLLLAITDASGKIKKELYTTPGQRDMVPGSAMMPLDEARDFVSVTLENPIIAGDRIRLLYPSKDGGWKPITCEEPDGQWEIVLKADDTTGINQLTQKKQYETAIYDLSGRRIAEPKHGVYIKNGRKIVLQ